MNDTFAIWGPRIFGIAAAWLVGYAGKHQLTLDQEQVTVLMIAAYSFLHRAISKHVNPADAAKAAVVEQSRDTVHTAELRTPR